MCSADVMKKKHEQKKYLWHLRHAAENDYWNHVLQMLEPADESRLLDCGCGDGGRTKAMAERAQASAVSGVEVVEELWSEAEGRGITAIAEDLNGTLSFADAQFDVVTSLEAIEHLHKPDTFVKELYRVLKPGGYAVVATENLASWHNIFALLCGWQPFTLSQFSEKKAAIGNPLGLDNGEDWNPALKYPSFRHCLVLSYRGFKEIFEVHGFTVESIRGAGYYPLPVFLARGMSACDPRHSAFLTIKVRKPL